jgi:ribonuclease I
MQPFLVKDLGKKWINANDVNNKKGWLNFLEHEWKKHGTYSGLSQSQYYQAALNQYNVIMTQLSTINAVGTGINVTTLRNQLNIQSLGLPGIVCGQDTMAPNKKLLVEIRFWINQQLTVFGKNPQPYKDCNLNVLYES